MWATIFCYLGLMPISLPRKLTALRFTGLIGFGISIFVVLTIFSLSFKHVDTMTDGHDVEYSFNQRLEAAWTDPKVTLWGVFNSLPLIIFSYMYQPNIPAIYGELKRRNMGNMKKVLGFGTGMASLAYILCGMFGYITFAKNPMVCEIMEEQNILKADYHGNVVVRICMVGLLFVVMFAAPFCVLPTKDSLEELLMSDQDRFTSKHNFFATFGIITFAYIIALTVPTIGDAMTILGATTNTFVGFLLPIIFYLKILGARGGSYSN